MGWRRSLARGKHSPSNPPVLRTETISSASHPGLFLLLADPPPTPNPAPDGNAMLPLCNAAVPNCDVAAVTGRRGRLEPGGLRDPKAGASDDVPTAGALTGALPSEVAVVDPVLGASFAANLYASNAAVLA